MMLESKLWKGGESGLFTVVPAARHEWVVASVLADVAQAVGVYDVATRVADALVDDVGAECAQVYVLGKGRGATLEPLASRGTDPPARALRVSEGEHPAARAASSAVAQVSDGQLDGAGPVALALPMTASDRVLGVVTARFASLTPRPADALRALAEAFGALLEREMLREEVTTLRELAETRAQRMELVFHDMRQPLNVLAVSAAYLARRGDARERPFLERVQSGVRILDRMIDDLNDASFLSTGTFRLHRLPSRIDDLVRHVTARHAPNVLVVSEPNLPDADIDPERFEQILMNLLVNAIKYGRDEAAIRIDVARCTAGVLVSVSNEGEPIPDVERERIFDPHCRGRSSTATRGSGLGLHICKTLVEAHRGRIWVESDREGTHFRFSLPTR